MGNENKIPIIGIKGQDDFGKDLKKTEEKSDVIKDSGKTREFGTGSIRDSSEDKVDLTLVPAYSYLKAKKEAMFIDTMGRTEKEYISDAVDAAMAYLDGQKDKDYLAIAAANAMLAVGYDESKEIVENYDIDDKEDVLSLLGSGLFGVAKHYEAGANKYGRNNWQLGQPLSVLLGSGLRHASKGMGGIKDEPHLRATAWNFLCAIWMEKYRPEMQDIETRKAK